MTTETEWDNTTRKKILKLFFFLPIWSFKQTANKKVWKLCGVPVFKIRRKKEGTKLKYLLFGFIPLMTVKIKRG